MIWVIKSVATVRKIYGKNVKNYSKCCSACQYLYCYIGFCKVLMDACNNPINYLRFNTHPATTSYAHEILPAPVLQHVIPNWVITSSLHTGWVSTRIKSKLVPQGLISRNSYEFPQSTHLAQISSACSGVFWKDTHSNLVETRLMQVCFKSSTAPDGFHKRRNKHSRILALPQSSHSWPGVNTLLFAISPALRCWIPHDPLLPLLKRRLKRQKLQCERLKSQLTYQGPSTTVYHGTISSSQTAIPSEPDVRNSVGKRCIPGSFF